MRSICIGCVKAESEVKGGLEVFLLRGKKRIKSCFGK